MTHKERQQIKKLKQEIELSLYSRIIECIVDVIGDDSDYDDLPTKERLKVTILMTKIRKLENKYIV